MAAQPHTSDLLRHSPLIPGYSVVRGLGAGGMATVYLARPLAGGPDVAIKCCERMPGRPDHIERFRQEVELLRDLDHPNIVKLLGYSDFDGRDYFVMEYAEGGTLRPMLTGTPMPIPRVRQIIQDIAAVFGYLAEQRIIHRDLKPENVFFTKDGALKVGDFGISKSIVDSGSYTATGQILGTLDYMAPEQRARLPVDERADQYSLAVMAYEMLTGKKPIGRFKSASTLNPKLVPQVDDVLHRALHEEADDRFASIPEFAKALDAALSRRPSHWGTVMAVGVIAAAIAMATASVSFIVNRRAEFAAAAVKSVETSRDRSNYYLYLGDKHVGKNDVAQALVCFNEAIRIDPTNPTPLLRRALLHKRNELPEEAVKDLKSVLVIDPENGEALKALGTIQVSLKDYDDAVALLNRALAINPKDADALAYRGWVSHIQKHDDQAQIDLAAAVASDTNCFVAHQFRALVATSQNDFPMAKAEFFEAVRCDNDNPFAHSGLALLLATCRDRSLRDGPEAVRHAKIACELTNWKDWKQIKILGQAHAANGDLPAAISMIEMAMPLAPALSQKRTLQPLLDQLKKNVRPAGGVVE